MTSFGICGVQLLNLALLREESDLGLYLFLPFFFFFFGFVFLHLHSFCVFSHGEKEKSEKP